VTGVDQLGVVVLTHGPEGEFGPLVDALVDQGVPGEAIALVQNPVSPSDPEPAPPAERAAVLRMPGNLAYAGGMNAGIRHQLERGARLVLILTQDLRPREGMVEALLAAERRAPAFGVLAPVLWVRDEDRVFSWGGRRGHRHGWVSHIVDGPPPARDGIAEVDWADGAALLLRREMLEQVGLLDEKLFIYFEETTLCLRATQAGWKVGLVLDAGAEQASGEGARPAFHAYLISRNGFEFARQSSGPLGVLAALRRALVQTWELARSYPGAEDGERSAARIKVAGTWLGFVDFARRRFGPPPERLRPR
jgi:GT2 family glycosyltransferase